MSAQCNACTLCYQQQQCKLTIIHLQIYRPNTDDYVYYDRFFGRAVTDDTASDGKIIIIIHNSAYTSSNSKLLLLQVITFTLQSKNSVIVSVQCACLSDSITKVHVYGAKCTFIPYLACIYVSIIMINEIMFLYSPTLLYLLYLLRWHYNTIMKANVSYIHLNKMKQTTSI